ncbi:hypothetical protein BMS3Abin03_01981 [bacterium BMS3Abin03]|nr:hypothetical protein BMS3Abin03_01981 [bacterium BMS3Abin03]
MKKIISFFLILFAAGNLSFAQLYETSFNAGNPVVLLDTINVFVGDQFDIKDKLSDWSSNFADINYSLGVFLEKNDDGNGNISFVQNIGGFEYKRSDLSYFRSTVVSLKSDVITGVNPGDYDVIISASINSPGTYYFVGVIKGRSEHGGYFEDAGYWVVNCAISAQNRMANTLQLKDTYYFGETAALDFSILGSGMDQLSNYYFRIFNSGKEIYSGIGAFINLNVITQNPAMVNKSFRVEGFYGGRIINFFNPSIPGTDSTVWDFKLLPPEKFEVVTNWFTEGEFNNLGKDDIIDALDMRDTKNRQFKFMYFSASDKGAIISKPEFNDLLITSIPPDFLLNSNDYTTYDKDIWKVIEINVNTKFLNNISDKGTKKIVLTIRFTTQFGERKSLTYVGYVF